MLMLCVRVYLELPPWQGRKQTGVLMSGGSVESVPVSNR